MNLPNMTTKGSSVLPSSDNRSMSDDPQAAPADERSPALAPEQALDELARLLHEASQVIDVLRRGLRENAAALHDAPAEPQNAEASVASAQEAEPLAIPLPTRAQVESAQESNAGVVEAAPAPTPAQTKKPDRLAVFDRLLDRIDIEKSATQEEKPSEPSSKASGLDLLPQQYLMTVEDREGNVDLVPLHRALLALASLEEANLVSYANGVPVVSLRVKGELDLEQLGSVVSTAMDRECEVIPQDNRRLYLRMKIPEALGG